MTTSSCQRTAAPRGGFTKPAVRNVRPFLKWAGGKRQLLPHLRSFYPESFGTYFEPFVGSGAVFFDLSSQGLLDDRAAVLSDVNRDVIGCYQALRRDVASVVRALRRLAAGHARDGNAHYYAVRDGRFNPQRGRLLDSNPRPGDVPYTASLAAMLIYLNRTGFNGLFRLNRGGRFNVPAGNYARPTICDADNLQRVASALGRPRTEIEYGGFDSVLDRAARGDFIYLDPPYVPVSATARFTAYTAEGFDGSDQRRLQRTVLRLAQRGCQILLSNSEAPETLALYDQDSDARTAGLRAFRVPARRAINSRASGRGPVAELIVTNIPASGAGPARHFF
jgi:DNA adenine methylase